MAEINSTTYTPTEIRASGDEALFPTTIVTVTSAQAAMVAGTVLGIITASGLAAASRPRQVGVLRPVVDPVKFTPPTSGRATSVCRPREVHAPDKWAYYARLSTP